MTDEDVRTLRTEMREDARALLARIDGLGDKIDKIGPALAAHHERIEDLEETVDEIKTARRASRTLRATVATSLIVALVGAVPAVVAWIGG